MTDTVRVPREPTREMLNAGASTLDDFWKAQERGPTHVQEAWPGIVQIYAAMLAASPQGQGSSGDAQGWRDIATAPRDGTKIIGLTKRGEVYRVWWHEFEEGWDWQDDFDSEQQIVGWMPLPPPPSADTKRSEPDALQSPVPIELSKNLGELKPDALPGDMRDSLEYIRDEAGRGLKTHPGQASLVLIQERADAILALIQTERAG